MDGADNIDSVRVEFIERNAVVARGEGLPRIARRIFDGRPISFGELAENLQVSRGSNSTSVRLLEERGVIKRMSNPGERRDYFRPGGAPFVKMLRDTKVRIGHARADIDDTIVQLPSGASEVRKRLREHSGFYCAIEDSLTQVIERLSQPRP